MLIHTTDFQDIMPNLVYVWLVLVFDAIRDKL